jgi:hypothetical protein
VKSETEPPESAEPASPPSPPGRSGAAPSRASSTASSRASDFVGDAGPPHDPGKAAPAPEAEPAGELHALPEPTLIWEEDRVRQILTAQGAALHAFAGVGEQDWLYTETDLLAITAPLTSILNRYPTTRAAAGAGDELALAIGLGGYVGRSWQERKAALDELAEEEEVPISGRAAPPGSAPDEPQEGQSQWTISQ